MGQSQSSTVKVPKPLPWDAFRLFWQKYARATEPIRDVYGVSMQIMYERVRNRPWAWAKLKFTAKRLYCAMYYRQYSLINPADANKKRHSYRNAVRAFCVAMSEEFDRSGLRYCPRLKNIVTTYYRATERNFPPISDSFSTKLQKTP